MIQIDKLKMVLYDFDDTLCIHLQHDYDENNKQSIHLHNVNILKYGKDCYNENTTTSTHMKKFMKTCEKLGIRQGLISATTSYEHFISKQEWVKERYGINLENFCVGTVEAKQEILLAIADAYEYDRDEILVVDDMWQTLSQAALNGFQTCTPIEIVIYEDRYSN